MYKVEFIIFAFTIEVFKKRKVTKNKRLNKKIRCLKKYGREKKNNTNTANI